MLLNAEMQLWCSHKAGSPTVSSPPASRCFFVFFFTYYTRKTLAVFLESSLFLGCFFLATHGVFLGDALTVQVSGCCRSVTIFLLRSFVLFSNSLPGVTQFLVIFRYARETPPFPSCTPMLLCKRNTHRKDTCLCSHMPGARECEMIQKPSLPSIVYPCTQWL